MGKKFFLPFILIITLFLIFSIACKKKEKAATPEIATAEIRGDLHILRVSPKGKTSSPQEAETIVSIFDQPMVPLEALPEKKEFSCLKLEPSFSGKFRWLGTKTLAFTPQERFPYATEIKATIPAGAQSLQGYTLKQDYSWTFRTVQPRLVKMLPNDGAKWVKLETPILLVFNQAVQKNKAKEFISFIEAGPDGKETPTDFELRSPTTKKLEEEEIKASPEEALVLEPKEKLKPDFTYYVELKKGLPAKEGPLGMDENQIVSFETFKSFKFENLEVEENHNPYEPLKFIFSNQVRYNEFVQKIHFEPEVTIPDYYSEWDHASETLWVTLPLEPEKHYSLRINPDLTDEFGNKLGKEVKLELQTAPYPPSLSMTTGFGILEAYSDLRYPLYAVNMEKIFFQAANIKKEEVLPLLTRQKIFWSNKKYIPKQGFFEVEKPLSLKLPKNKRQIVPLDLKDLLPERYGFVFFQLDTGSSDEWERYPKAFLQVTEIGISSKFSPENNVVWVTELRTGLLVAEAEVEIRDDANTVRWRGKTDKEGKVQTPGWKQLGITSKDQWTKPQQWVFAKRGKDQAFLSSEWGTGIDPYRFGIEYDWNPEPQIIQGYIFTERGIYRAGEKVYIKGIIRKREKGQWKLPSAKEIECEVQDPFQKVIHKNKISLDSFGSFSLDLETNEEASLGYYQILAKVPPETEAEKVTDIYGTFQVEAFRPAEFEVHLRTPKESFVFGEDYKAQIRGNYLFGGTMAGQKASWHLRFNKTSFSPPGQKGYIFGNELDWGEWEEREESRLITSGEGALDAEGKLEIKIPLVPEKEKDSVLATLEATVQSPSRRSISSRIQTVIHRGEFYIGLRPNTYFVKKGDPLAISLVAVTPQGASLPEKKISVKLLKREWRSVRKAGVGGRFKWITEKEDTEIEGKQVQTKNEPVEVSFMPEKSGLYFIQAEGQDGRKNTITTTTSIYVTGKDYVPWERRDDDTVELVPDSNQYLPGDKAKILIKSPYERAKALITVEREYVLESQVFEIVGSSNQIEIPILSDYIPNIYVSVLLVQGRTSSASANENEDVGKPSFKIGYAELKVNPSEKRLKIEISTDKKDYKPKEKVSLRLKVQDQKNSGHRASISVAVADVGVLNLIGYQTPNPFDQFYGPKPLSVQTSETRLQVVGQREFGEKGEEVGGGAGEKMMAPGMTLAEVELRGDFKSTAYWNPSLLTDEKGEASLSFILPDNLTTFRIMAMAQTEDSEFGQAESTFKVTKPLLLQAALPRFARVGDKFKGGVVVHNLSDQRGEVVLSCDVQGIHLLDQSNIQRLPLGQGESKEILYTFDVEKPGKAIFAFRAQLGKEADGLEAALPLKVPRPTESVAFFEQTTQSTVQEVTIPENIYPSESKIEVQAASSVLAGLKGCVDYLTDYPYLCLEQRLSSILPYLVAPNVIQDFHLSKLTPQEIQKHVRANIKDISSYQKNNGSFGLWPDSLRESPFITCYAAFALVKAQEAGYEINKEEQKKTASYLSNLLRKKFDEGQGPYDLRIWNTVQAFALYDLALLNQPEPAYAEKLFSERNRLTLFGQALLLKAMHHGKGSLLAKNTLVQELLNKIKVTPTAAHFEDDAGEAGGWIYSSNARTTAIILQSLIEIGAEHPLTSSIAKWLVEKGKAGGFHSTQENFYLFYALNDFYRQAENIKPDFRMEISLAEKTLLPGIFNKWINPTLTAEASLSEFKKGKTLPMKIYKKGEGTLYYGARMTYAPSQKLPPRDEGLAILKRIESPEGKPLESLKAGSLVIVTLEVAVPQECLFVVIDDPLPAGLEAVNPTFLIESTEEQQRLEARDESDRFRWWDGFNHIEMRDDRVLLFADSLSAGIHIHRYLARALIFGLFQTPGTKAEEMYSPEVFGRTSEQVVKIIE